jgi:hypothetical protein
VEESDQRQFHGYRPREDHGQHVHEGGGGEDDDEQRVAGGARHGSAEGHRGAFPGWRHEPPVGRVFGLFMEDLQVAADPLRAKVQRPDRFERRQQDDEGHGCSGGDGDRHQHGREDGGPDAEAGDQQRGTKLAAGGDGITE